MDVAVFGASRLGQAVAQICAVAGHDVHLYDEEANAVMDGIDTIERRLPADTDVTDRLSGTTGRDAAVADADIVVETSISDAATLQTLFADIEGAVGRDTLIAAGVEGIAVTAAAAGLRHPERAVGLRFREPLEQPLVEVVAAEQTSERIRERASAFVAGLDRSPVVVRDTPGVVSTRAALALEAEAMRLVDEGVASVQAVDDVLELGYGHEHGPLVQADRAGLDTRLDALEQLSRDVSDRFDPPAVLRDRVDAGKLGKQSGEGFYRWENGDPVESAVTGPEFADEADPSGTPDRE